MKLVHSIVSSRTLDFEKNGHGNTAEVESQRNSPTGPNQKISGAMPRNQVT